MNKRYEIALIRRTGKSNDRVTEDKIYRVFNDGKRILIYDDKGNCMEPSLNAGPDYWIDVSYLKQNLNNIENTSMEKTNSVKLNIRHEILVDLPNKEGVVLSSLSQEEILSIIATEENLKEALSKFKTKSKAINKMRAKHEDNISQLVAVLDSNES